MPSFLRSKYLEDKVDDAIIMLHKQSHTTPNDSTDNCYRITMLELLLAIEYGLRLCFFLLAFLCGVLLFK